MNVFVIGIGLIGGSFALDLKAAYADVVIYGIDHNPDYLEQALALHIIDRPATMENLGDADIVWVAVPVTIIAQLLPTILHSVRNDAVVIDAGSTKQVICQCVANHPKRRNFLAAHPIAGTEFSGPRAAHTGLFRGKTNIICEVEKTAFPLQERALKVFSDVGMRIRYMDAASHDRHIAYMSHLSHISSFMLGKTVMEKEKNERDIFDMASSGFESTVRLAKSSPEMWAPIFEQNKENVLETLAEYIANLQEFRDRLANDDFKFLYADMEGINKIKEVLNGIGVTKI